MKIGFIVGRNDPTGDGEVYETNEIKKIVKKKHMSGLNKKQIMIDVGIAYYVKLHYPDIDVDIIMPNELSDSRLQKNDINFQIGYDVINAMVDSPKILKFKNIKVLDDIFKKKKNKIYPPYEHLQLIWNKTKYMKFLDKHNIPISKTIYYKKKTPINKLILSIKNNKWKSFIIKPIGSTTNIGIEKFTNKGLNNLSTYFQSSKFQEFLVQEVIDGFSEYGEIKTFWINGEYSFGVKIFSYGEEFLDEIDDYIEPNILKRIKEIGNKILKIIPPLKFNRKQSIPVMLRIDFACCKHNKKFHPNNLFVNEIEYQDAGTYTNLGVTYPIVPILSDAFVKRARQLVS
jgi:hypothetical protein